MFGWLKKTIDERHSVGFSVDLRCWFCSYFCCLIFLFLLLPEVAKITRVKILQFLCLCIYFQFAKKHDDFYKVSLIIYNLILENSICGSNCNSLVFITPSLEPWVICFKKENEEYWIKKQSFVWSAKIALHFFLSGNWVSNILVIIKYAYCRKIDNNILISHQARCSRAWFTPAVLDIFLFVCSSLGLFMTIRDPQLISVAWKCRAFWCKLQLVLRKLLLVMEKFFEKYFFSVGNKYLLGIS